MQLASSLTKHWLLLFIRGLIAAILGLATWFSPQASLQIILLVFAGYFFIDGTLRIWIAVSSKHNNPLWWLLLTGGLLCIAAALVTLFAPDITALLLLYYVAAWAIAIGCVEVVVAMKLHHEVSAKWLLIITGILSVVFGLYLIFNPGAGILTLLRLVAGYAIIFGSLMMLFSFKLKSIPKT